MTNYSTMQDNNLSVLNEKDLQLVVSTKTLGSLTTNAEKIRDLVKSSLSRYSIENYSSDNIDKAKEDKAKLNKAAKVLNDERIKIEKEWMKPFGEFKEIVTETVGLIKQCVSEIDTIVKADDERIKAEKRKQVENLSPAREIVAIGVPLIKVWNDKWLNKTVSIKSIEKELSERLNGIKSDLETLKTFSEDYTVLSTLYKDILNLNECVAYANKLMAARAASKTESQTQEVETPKEDVQAPKTSLTVANTADVDDAFAAAMGLFEEASEKIVSYEVEVPQHLQADFELYLSNLGISFNII